MAEDIDRGDEKAPPQRPLVAEALGRRSVDAKSTRNRRRDAVEDFNFDFNFPGEGTDGEQSAIAAPPRSADAQSTRHRR